MQTPLLPGRVARHFLVLLLALALSPWAGAWELEGVKTLSILTREQQLVPIGTVEFTPIANGAAGFQLRMDSKRFTDHFLSMKEFKCLEGGDEVLCHVPYPYRTPGVVDKRDYAWLEHSLLFLYKQPRDFGAKLWNGLYYRLEADRDGLVGYPQAVDLNLISAPPDDLTKPPYDKSQRDDVAPGAHWIERLVIR
ncbi:MAG: hypothetical protein HXX19_18490 [Rhodoferax sp.]|nr:hypothetical protein [Rhodoferax sp.]